MLTADERFALYEEVMALLSRANALLIMARKEHELALFQAEQNAQTVIRQAHEIRNLEHDVSRSMANHVADINEVQS